MFLKFKHKKAYGQNYFYPNNEESVLFIKLFDWKGKTTKTLSLRQIEILKKLNVNLEIQQEDLAF